MTLQRQDIDTLLAEEAAPRPYEDEPEDDFMRRCMRDGTGRDECRRLWERGEGAAMKYPRVVGAFLSSPWAILPEKLSEISAILARRLAGERASEEVLAKFQAGPREGYYLAGRVAVVPVHGVLAQRVSSMDRMSGGISTEELGATLERLVGDKQVKSILLDIDSPGGSVFGLPELADKIRSMRDEKKIVAYANPVAASAAYWIASQCSEIYMTPSGQVGSIGVITAHEDFSKALDAAGVKVTTVTSSKYKAEFDPSVPLSEEARNELMSKVSYYHNQFTGAIAKGRGVTQARVESGFGQGRMMTADQAKEAGLVDGAMTLERVLSRMGGVSAEGETPAIVAEAPHDPVRAAARLRDIEIRERRRT